MEIDLIYQEKLERMAIILDKQQWNLLRMLEVFLLKSRSCSNMLRKIFKISNPIGFYIYGPVGTGKSMLMKLFCDRIVHRKKCYLHSTDFINHLLNICNGRSLQDHLPAIIKTFASYDMIFLDEFDVRDIASSVIVRKVIESLWAKGIIFGFTSNVKPCNLYINGLQRDLFLQFINNINEHCMILQLCSEVDYRTIVTTDNINFLYAQDESECESMIIKAFDDLCSSIDININEQEKQSYKVRNTIVINDITLQVKYAYRNILCSSFKSLCSSNLASYDYRALGQKYDHVFIYNINRESFENIDICRRFVAIIDEFYEVKTKLHASFSFNWKMLHNECNKVSELGRTISRLYEMEKW